MSTIQLCPCPSSAGLVPGEEDFKGKTKGTAISGCTMRQNKTGTMRETFSPLLHRWLLLGFCTRKPSVHCSGVWVGKWPQLLGHCRISKCAWWQSPGLWLDKETHCSASPPQKRTWWALKVSGENLAGCSCPVRSGRVKEGLVTVLVLLSVTLSISSGYWDLEEHPRARPHTCTHQ